MLFFVLSGFLITWLMLKERDKTGSISLKSFFKRRILRIFPAFYVYWILAIVLLLITKKAIPWTHAFSAAFYVSNYYYALNPESNNLFSHTWSLAVEEQFYLIFPFIFLAFQNSTKNLSKALTLLIVIVWLWRVVLVYGLGVGDSYIYCAFDTRIDHLLVGCLLAVILREKYFPRFWKIILSSPLMPVLTIILIALSIFLGDANSLKYKDTVGFAVEPILMAVLIVQLILFSASFWWQWLEWRFIKYLGTISYSLYLYQQLTLHPAVNLLSNFVLVIQVAGAVIVTISAATFSYYLVEKPFLRLRNVSFKKFS